MTTEAPFSSGTTESFAPGTVLVGKYRVERLLGQGGMGWVVVATHLQLEQRVALKFMHAQNAKDSPEAVGRFVREARAAARIQSEHVARVSDVGTLENGSPYLVMEYLEGHDLEAELRSGREMPIAQVVDYAMQACEGLAEAHAAGIVHRDLKPGNLFLARRSDGSLRVKLLDFGISKLAPLQGSTPEIAMTSTQTLMGSPLYMSPEQLRSSKNVDRRADIWSMGVILFEMLCGRAPFDGDTLPEVCARIMAEPPASLRGFRISVPVALETVAMRCLEKDPQRRFQHVADLALALAPFGSPEARAGAERISRLSRASTGSRGEFELAAGTLSAAAGQAPASAIAQTNAAFIAAEPAGLAHRPSLRWLVWAGALLLVIGGIVSLVATRGRNGEAGTATATGSGSGSASGTATTSGTATAAESAITLTPAPTFAPTPATAIAPTPTPTITPAPAAAVPVHAPATAGTPLFRAPPKAKPAAPKPASTSGFGGRD